MGKQIIKCEFQTTRMKTLERTGGKKVNERQRKLAKERENMQEEGKLGNIKKGEGYNTEGRRKYRRQNIISKKINEKI